MQIKRFEAKTMTAALKMVKDEFGVNAVILSARSLRQGQGFFGMGRAAGVEVTAANDSGEPVYRSVGPIVSDRSTAIGRSGSPDGTMQRGLFQSLNRSLRSLTHRRGPSATEPAARRPPPDLAQLYRHLLAQEVERDLAAELIAQIQRLPGFDTLLRVDGLQSYALRMLHDMGLPPAADPPAHGTPGIRVLVGPGGAGKTTTAIKLAARKATRSESRNVALMTLDDHRIGAIEQARIFGSILSVPVAVATSAAMVEQAGQAFQSMDWLIVDTPGVNAGEPQRLNELRHLLEPLKNKEVHLVLNGCTREKDLRRTIDTWRGFPVDRLVFTRIDEAGACGHLLNLLVRTGLPLSDLGTGPRIPEDLADQPLVMLLGRIWPGREHAAEARGERAESAPPETPMPDRSQRVANGSSELYHRPDCKWVQKIKPEHLIHFTSAAQAESRRFAACRNCHPHREDRPAAAAACSAAPAAGSR